MISKFNQFNESVRDLMKPKPEEEIAKSLSNLTPAKKVERGVYYSIPWIVQQGIDEAKKQHEIVVNSGHVSRALLNKDFEMVKMLVEGGVRDLDNDWLVGNAYRYGNLEIVKFLIEHGATANRVGVGDFYKWMRSGKNTEILKLFADVSPILQQKLKNKAKLIDRDLKRINEFL